MQILKFFVDMLILQFSSAKTSVQWMRFFSLAKVVLFWSATGMALVHYSLSGFACGGGQNMYFAEIFNEPCHCQLSKSCQRGS